MEDTINQRVKKARISLNLSQDEVAEAINKTVSAISKIESGTQRVDNDLISFYYRKGVSYDWMQDGVEPMFQRGTNLHINKKTDHGWSNAPTVDTKSAETKEVFGNGKEKHHEVQQIPLYDVTAAAGLTSLYNSTSNILDYISIPNLPRCDGAIYVKGDSMYPLLKHGDMVAFQRLMDIPDDIMFGEMYVVDMSTPHMERIVVKYVQESDKGEEYVRLVSYNEKHHKPKDVPLKKIRAIAAVKASIRIN